MQRVRELVMGGAGECLGQGGSPLRRVAFAGGGTAGHIYPALAVAAAYRKIVPDADILFLGTPLGLEGTLVPAAGHELETLPGSPFFGSSAGGKLRSLRNAVAGMEAAARVFRGRGTQGLLSFGGYASAGPVLAARRAGLVIAICELNVAPGLTNRLFARFADRVFLACAETKSAFARTPAVVTGVPVRSALRNLRWQRRHPEPPWRILILGGSLGSAFLNAKTPPLLARMRKAGLPLIVHHQCGSGHEEAVRRLYAGSGIEATVSGFVHDIAALYAWADLAITCAGAVTLAELAAVGLPALVVPLSAASEDHQAANADAFSQVSGCPWVRERDWEETRLARELDGLLRGGGLPKLADRLCRATEVDAAAVMARQFEALLTGGSKTKGASHWFRS